MLNTDRSLIDAHLQDDERKLKMQDYRAKFKMREQ